MCCVISDVYVSAWVYLWYIYKCVFVYMCLGPIVLHMYKIECEYLRVYLYVCICSHTCTFILIAVYTSLCRSLCVSLYTSIFVYLRLCVRFCIRESM